MPEFLILADEHAQLIVIHTDVLINHPVWNHTSIIYIFIKEREHHIRVVHSGLAVCFLGKAVVVVIGFHDLDEFIDGVMELMMLAVVTEHLAHFGLGESHHLVETIVQ